jgi:UDP-N-acetylmuramyl pentapeptide synthase
LNYAGKEISHNLLGGENNHYVTLGFDIARDVGIEITKTTYDFQLTLQTGRFSLFLYTGHILIDSTYNAAPESMKQVLVNTKFLQKKLFPDYVLIGILGDMRELGNPQEAHRELAFELIDFSHIFTVGPNIYEYMIPELKKIGYRGSFTSSLSSRDVGQKLKNFLDTSEQKYLIVFKGSQNTIFIEEALAVLLSPEDQKKLPRQSYDWKQKKEAFFQTLFSENQN